MRLRCLCEELPADNHVSTCRTKVSLARLHLCNEHVSECICLVIAKLCDVPAQFRQKWRSCIWPGALGKNACQLALDPAQLPKVARLGTQGLSSLQVLGGLPDLAVFQQNFAYNVFASGSLTIRE